MTELSITVPGTPVPQGSKRIVSSRGRSGRAWMIDANDSTLRPWRATVTAAAIAAIPPGWVPSGAFQVFTQFHLARPKSHYGAKGVLPSRSGAEHAQKPDLDKLCRAVLDSLTDAGVWRDDSQVYHLHATKLWAVEHPKCVITVWGD